MGILPMRKLHEKPIVIINADGYDLLGFLASCVEMGFVRQPLLDSTFVETEIDAVFARLKSGLRNDSAIGVTS